VRQGLLQDLPAGARWVLRGFTSNMRYTTRTEAKAMAPVTSPLGRDTAHLASMIAIRKSPAWWALTQDERRTIYEERSRHTSIGLEYMPQIARRLHHSRDLGEPFDFLTWFEFGPDDARDFDRLLERLRAGEEWSYVDREVELRLERAPDAFAR
jgi:chlorite dismutase